MTSSLVLKATAAVTVLAAAAAVGSYYVSVPAFLSSPPFLWVAANVIIVWLLSSSRWRSSGGDAHAGAAGYRSSAANDVLSAVDELYPPSDYDGYSSAVSTFTSVEAPVVVSRAKRQQAREARAVRKTDRAKKPAGEAAAAPMRTGTRGTGGADDDKKRGVDEAAVPATPTTTRHEDDDDDDVSLDSLWQSMVQRRAVRPVAVRKSETWGNDELPQLQRAAENAAARRREMRKSVSSAAPPPPTDEAQASAPAASAVRQLGWRTRDVLVRAQDDLLRRAESLIRRHHEQLRLQRQESQQRQAQAMEERQRGRGPALIRV